MKPLLFSPTAPSSPPPPFLMPTDGDRTQLAGRQILVVEDEAFISLDLEMALLDLGAGVVGPAASLSEGLASVADGPPDGAILDVDLGGVDVDPLAHHLAQQGVPFVFHTGHGTRRDLSKAFPLAPVCKKPTDTERVLNALAAVMFGAEASDL